LIIVSTQAFSVSLYMWVCS